MNDEARAWFRSRSGSEMERGVSENSERLKLSRGLSRVALPALQFCLVVVSMVL